MKALLVPEYGGPEVLTYDEFPDPATGPEEVLVGVKATALNHLDLFVRSGIPGLHLEMPHILGGDVSGEIVDLGCRTTYDLAVGQRVVVDPAVSCGTCEFCIRGQRSLCPDFGIIGEHYRGGNAELLAVHEDNIIPIPSDSDLDFVEAAAVPLTFMTAWRMLMTRARVRPGEDVLIIGIGGGVATAALQIAKVVGARVFVTSSSDEKLERAGELGADFGINYIKTPEYHKEVWRLTEERGVDIVVDSVGAATWEKSLRSLRKGGRLVTCGATSGPKTDVNINRIFWNQLEILGSTMASRSELRDVLKLVWRERLQPVIDKVFPLSQGQKAHERLEQGNQFGKIVLRL